MHRITIAALIVWLCALAAHGQREPTGPTLAETLSLLKDHIAKDGGYDSDESSTGYRPLDFSTCTVSWLQFDDLESIRAKRTTIPLSDVDSKSVTSGPFESSGVVFEVKLPTKSGRKTIRHQIADQEFMMTGSINVLFRDQAVAQRVAEAFAHAATLCAKESF